VASAKDEYIDPDENLNPEKGFTKKKKKDPTKERIIYS